MKCRPARICLLDAQRRSVYDTKLHERVANELPSAEPAQELISLPLEEFPVLDQPWSEDPLQRVPLPRLHPTTASTAPRRRESGEFRRSVELPSIRVGWPVALGGLATIGVCLIALGWLFRGSDDPRATNGGASQDRSADSSLVATVDRPGQGPAPGSSRNTPDARPPQPPGPITQQDKPKEPRTESTGTNRTDGSTSTTSEETNRVEGQQSGSPRSAPPDVQEGDGFGNSMSGDDVPDDATAGSRLDRSENLPQACSAMRGNKPVPTDAMQVSKIQKGTRNSRADPHLLKQTRHPSSIVCRPNLISHQRSQQLDQRAFFFVNSCRLLTLTGRSCWKTTRRHQVNPGFSRCGISPRENLTRWPVISLASADDSPPITEASVDDTPGKAPLAHIEAGPTGLFLKFSASASPELIEQFSLCRLVFRNDSGQHCIQLQASERIPPLTLAFDDSKETVTLDELPAAAMLSLDRIMLEVVRVELGGVQAPTGSGLRANLDKELTVPLDSQLQCELGIKLSESDGQFAIVVLPRYKVNDRRQQLGAGGNQERSGPSTVAAHREIKGI